LSSAAALPVPLHQARGVLFDMDGTLLDTAPDMANALNRLRAEAGLVPLAFAGIRPHVSHGSNAVVKHGFPDVDATRFEQLRLRFLELYADGLAVETRLFAGFEPVLERLEAQQIPWGIVTNKPGFLSEPLLAALQLRARAACVLSGDSLPERKPHPRPLLVAAEALGVAPALCVYVGDAERDIRAALSAGMIALGASFGYLGPDDAPATWGAAAWLAAPGELLAWVANE
jgi:N-acetyl-D-muramate 6-phosphate phosphatase